MESSVVGEHLVPPLWNQVEWSYRCTWGVKIGVLGMPITSRPFPDGYYVYFMCLHVSTPLSDKSVQGLYQTLKTCMDIKINVANIYSLELSKLTQTRAQEKHFLSSTRKKCVVYAHLYRQSAHTEGLGACLCVNFPDSKEFLHHLIQRMIELHFWVLVLIIDKSHVDFLIEVGIFDCHSKILVLLSLILMVICLRGCSMSCLS